MNRSANVIAIIFGITVFAAAMNDTIDHWLTLAVVILGGGGLAFIVLREVAKEILFKFEMMAMDRHEAERQLEYARSTVHIPKAAPKLESVPVVVDKEDDDG